MISKISIQNFKSLKKVDLDCSSLNLFSGLNGLGKSSVLQTFLLLKQSFDKGYLKKDGLTLKGDLVNIGVGKDALYQNADKDEIIFNLSFKKEQQTISHSWVFGYASNTEQDEYNYSDSDVIAFSEDTAIPENLEELSLFNSHFKYLHAERWVKNQYERSDFQVIRNRNLGKHGEFTAHFLAYFGPKKSEEIHNNLLYPKTDIKTLEYQVSAWMNEISPGTIVNAAKIPGVDAIKLSYEFDGRGGKTNEISPLNVGFGITYVLPIIVMLLSAKPGDILVIENPESHLHPKGQSAIGRLMALSAMQGVQLFIESHSDHILNGIRVAVKNGVSAELVKLFFFERTDYQNEIYSSCQSPKLDQDGRINIWPENFFDEWDNNLMELL